MYEADSEDCSTVSTHTDHSKGELEGGLGGVTIGEMKNLAADFAANIPPGFSPAELQAFLMKRKKDPRRAVVEVGAWVDGILRQKVSKKKVLQVQ
jgi:hypothetical protein